MKENRIVILSSNYIESRSAFLLKEMVIVVKRTSWSQKCLGCESFKWQLIMQEDGGP